MDEERKQELLEIGAKFVISAIVAHIGFKALKAWLHSTELNGPHGEVLSPPEEGQYVDVSMTKREEGSVDIKAGNLGPYNLPIGTAVKWIDETETQSNNQQIL